MLTFTNEQSLQAYINQMIGNVLQREVASTVIKQQSQSAKKLIYDAYSPKYYTRRMSMAKSTYSKFTDTGREFYFKNYDTVYSNNENSHSISIESIINANPTITLFRKNRQITTKSKNAGKRLIELLETGGVSSYDFPYDTKKGENQSPYALASYTKPRPIIATTISSLRQSKAIETSFKVGMETRGFNML